MELLNSSCYSLTEHYVAVFTVRRVIKSLKKWKPNQSRGPNGTIYFVCLLHLKGNSSDLELCLMKLWNFVEREILKKSIKG